MGSIGRPSDWKTSVAGRTTAGDREADDLEERRRQAWITVMNERSGAGERKGSSGWTTEQEATIQAAYEESEREAGAPPEDTTATFFKELSRQETDRRLRQGTNRYQTSVGTLL